MLGAINHIAIAVPDLTAAALLYQRLGGEVSAPQDLAEHGVTVVFVQLPNTKIELLHPFGANSPIASFLDKNPAGGIHHICFEVDDIHDANQVIINSGLRVLGGGEPKNGAHGLPVLFAHPKDFFGTLVEFEQATLRNPEEGSADRQMT